MKNRFIRLGLALSFLVFRSAAAADYLADFSLFPAYAYNTVAYLQGGAYVGCGPTTGAMMFGYFQERHSLTGLLTSPGTGANTGLNTAWALHGQSYMKTGNNGFGDVTYIEPGLEQYAADMGFTLKVTIHASSWYSDPASADAAWLNAYGPYGDAWMNDGAFWIRNANGTWTIDPDLFCDFMAMCLGQGVPVFLTIDTNADGGGDHWVPLVGYDRAAKKYAFYNTYDTALHWADIYYMGDPAGKRANSISMVRTVELMLAEPDIAVDWMSWDFGSEEIGGDNPVHYLTVNNEGGADLEVSGVALSGSNAADFTILNPGSFTLMPGNGRQIGVRFNPASAGIKTAQLVLASNDPDENPLTIPLTGTGTDGSGTPMQLLKVSLGQGTVNDLASIGTTLFAGTEGGGVLVSTDHGSTWNPANTGLTNMTVRCLLADGTRLYAGTWGGGVFRTDDEGGLWSPMSSGMTNLDVTSLAIDPPGLGGSQRMLAGTWGGVFSLIRPAEIWTGLNTGLTETHVRSVFLSGPYAFAGTIDGLFRSPDLGQTWAPVHNGLTNTAVIALERRGGILFAGTDGGGVFFSGNNGDAWAGYFLTVPAAVVPDLKAFDTGLFVATWGSGPFFKDEESDFGLGLTAITESNIRSVTVACIKPDGGEYAVLAGTESGDVWFYYPDKKYPVVVDAEKDPFFETLTGPGDGFLQLRSYAWNDAGAPGGDDDLSARIWTAWDEKWFYLYEEVNDDLISADGPNAWEQDGLELKFDCVPADTTIDSVWDDRLTALDAATGGIGAWDNLTHTPQYAWKQWARKTVPGGYILELAVQWQAVTANGESIVPQEGTEFGMAIKQHDRDAEGGISSMLQWSAVLLDAVWNTPKYMGTVRLLADHRVQFIPTNKMTGVTNPVPYDGSEYTRSAVAGAATAPAAFGLMPNYPNPFNPSTTVSFYLSRASVARIAVFDVQGREVAVLADGRLEAGVHRLVFDGAGLVGGVYLLKLETESGAAVRKMALVK
jgi:hypothetical protein